MISTTEAEHQQETSCHRLIYGLGTTMRLQRQTAMRWRMSKSDLFPGHT